MKPLLRIPRALFEIVKRDLSRSHSFAYERVGFILSRTSEDGYLSLAFQYIPIDDKGYVKLRKSGATINTSVIHDIMQTGIDTNSGLFHVHMHRFSEDPRFSITDIENVDHLIPPFQVILPKNTHGALVIGENSGSTIVLRTNTNCLTSGRVSIIGYPTRVRRGRDEY